MPSRRSFLLASGGAGLLPAAAAVSAPAGSSSGAFSIDGPWRFRLDAETTWHEVSVPHTWQTSAATAEYFGVAWYEREFTAPIEWKDSAVRVEFEAVFHSASVTVNDRPAGEHLRKGYTAFTIDATPHLKWGTINRIRVRVNNDFDEHMLPRGKSSDWTHDGGIYRPVRLLVTPKLFVERIEIDAPPNLSTKTAEVRIRAVVRNLGAQAAEGALDLRIVEEGTDRPVLQKDGAARYNVPGRQSAVVALAAVQVENARLWHFDHPNLYRACVRASSGHAYEDTFGIRSLETRDGAFFLNGEKIRPMGVERMAGSNPEFGMAEPSSWIEHDHDDMRNLNCVYTRVHWPQDRRVLDYCDRNGVFMQTEVPTWGPGTFKGMKTEPDRDILDNGLEQLREMIARDRNHPCLFSWGVCNEIGGQNPPAYSFAKTMYAEAKRLDPLRLVTYASHSLKKDPGKDVSGLMDYVMCNEYYESWSPGTPQDLARNLDEIHQAFPGKAIVISEYGWCACTADRPEGDSSRARVLREHDAVFRERPWVAGLIFFCYNDYRTHVGDKGRGVMKQRVHGVVDVYGARKPSYEVLRSESSPVEFLHAKGRPAKLSVALATRTTVPAYVLRGYTLRAVAYGFGEIPIERLSTALPEMKPGQTAQHEFKFHEAGILRIQLDVLRPDGQSVSTGQWKF